MSLDKLIFLDEMGAGLNLSPLYGRAPSDQRVYDEAPVAKGQRISMVGAMTSAGMKTALNFEGTMTGLVFLYFLKHFLCPLLAEGDYVVMDNASVHKVDEIKDLIQKTGAKLIYLPPYSPDLNPIELAWNKIKQYLRKQRPRTVEALYQAYAEGLKCISTDNALSFVNHSMKFAI
ncbi:IS630 family transposase [Methyloprofundus sedimenti]|uniref:IS630 family transposase n=1 Tax=Methyloprofundus sedimenti TaxID=1420851 RepID=UPI0022B92394|nr:IS630 family transposase [Methyloprofundus sedimenti]